MKIIVFGAGSIGRSLLGHLFSRAGYEVVFVDIVDEIVRALNERGRYKIVIKDIFSEVIWVKNVRAIHAGDVEKISDEIATADIIATAVGVNNLPSIYPTVAKGLVRRRNLGRGAIDILICENIRDASKLFREGLLKFLPKDYPVGSMVGLVETCIGKMVPLMSEEERKKDILMVVAEAYDKMIVDAKAFKCEVPKVEGIIPKENIAAYIDQKLFVHNMGHAVTAYLGYITDPNMKYIWEAISNPPIRETVEKAMWESGEALIREYPSEFNRENMEEYIEDLIQRFNNKALGDTIYRVGRDLLRKLSRNDRLIGALLLDKKHFIPFPYTSLGVAAALLFRGKDEKGRLYSTDEFFVKEIYPRGIDFILEKICGLNPDEERNIINAIKEKHKIIIKNPENWRIIIEQEAN
jgi:mannitol-1-phosphate 5-dehydrogenase